MPLRLLGPSKKDISEMCLGISLDNKSKELCNIYNVNIYNAYKMTYFGKKLTCFSECIFCMTYKKFSKLGIW